MSFRGRGLLAVLWQSRPPKAVVQSTPCVRHPSWTVGPGTVTLIEGVDDYCDRGGQYECNHCERTDLELDKDGLVWCPDCRKKWSKSWTRSLTKAWDKAHAYLKMRRGEDGYMEMGEIMELARQVEADRCTCTHSLTCVRCWKEEG